MKKHKVKNIVKTPDGHTEAVFTDGFTMFLPNDKIDTLTPGMCVTEHVNKRGTTVAFSWFNNIRFVGAQPMYYNDAVKFIKDFKVLDRVRFNASLTRVMHHRNRNPIFPNTDAFAHNLIVYGLRCRLRER